MAGRRRLAGLGLALALLPAGCSWVEDVSGRGPLGPDGPHLFGGVRTLFDPRAGMMRSYVSSKGSGFGNLDSGTLPRGGGGKEALVVVAILMAPLLVPVAAVLVDFSLSLALDTISFPFVATGDLILPRHPEVPRRVGWHDANGVR